MDKDKTLNNEKKIILLICGDSKTGKKTLVNNWLKEIEYKEKDYTFYKEYIFSIEEIIDEKKKIF
jgi:septin family protein